MDECVKRAERTGRALHVVVHAHVIVVAVAAEIATRGGEAVAEIGKGVSACSTVVASLEWRPTWPRAHAGGWRRED